MKKIYFLKLFMLLFTFINMNAQNWVIYEGNVLPSETGGTSFDLTIVSDNSPGPGFVEEIINDTEKPGNKILKYYHPDGKLMYRSDFDEGWTDSTLTIVARLKGIDVDTIDRVFDIQWRNGNAGTREELRISPADSTIELEKADIAIKVNYDLYQWHVYRIAVYGDSCAVFIDEDETAVLTGITTSSTTDSYIKFGDGSGEHIAGYVDWIIMDTTDAFTPDVASLPGELVNPYFPNNVYHADVLPGETGTVDYPFDFSSVSDDSPGAGMIQEIIDDPDVPGNKVLKYLHPDGKLMFRTFFDDDYTDSTLTIIARLKGENDEAYDRVFDIQWRNGNAGTRDELRISAADSTIELEKASASVKVDMDLYDWHIYRVAVYGDSAAVFIDEDPTPVLTGVSTSSTTDKYLKIGDGTGDAIGGYLDWILLDTDKAATPEEFEVPGNLQLPYYPWIVYDGSILPEETPNLKNSMDLNSYSDDSPGAGLVAEVVSDPKIAQNKLFYYYHPDGKRMYRTFFGDNWTDSTFSIVARIKGVDVDTIDRAFDIQWRNGNAGTRDELRIWPADSIVELEKADVEIKVDANLYEWHTYRISVYGDSSVLFIDENPVPVLSGKSTSSTTDAYIKIGDGSGEHIGGYLDWIVLDTTEASVPGDKLLPDVLTGIKEGEIAEWKLYSADVLPDANDPVFEESSVVGTTHTNQIIDDPDSPGNRLLEMTVTPAASSFLWKYNFEEETQDALTSIFRVKAVSDTVDRPVEIDLRHGGFRERLFINTDNTFELKYADVKGNLPNVQYWHTFRITKSGDMVKVYLDENPEPFAEVVTPQTDSENYFRFGDGNSSTSIGSFIDYVIWNESGAFSPLDLPLPDSLLVGDTVSYDATIAEVNMTSGRLVPEFQSDILDYDLYVPADSSTVTVTAVANHEKSVVTGDGLITVPDTVTINVTAEDGSQLDYIFRVTVDTDTLSHDATLSAIEVSAGELSPAFSPQQTEYELLVPIDSSSVTITGIPTDEKSVVAGDGEVTEFPSEMTISVTAEDSVTIMDYTINLMKPDTTDYGYGNWLVYNASVLPSETGTGENNLDLTSLSQDAPGANFEEEIVYDDKIPDNMLLYYNQPDDVSTKMYRSYFGENWTGTDFTLAARIKGVADNNIFRPFDIQYRHGNAGMRDELRIWPNDSLIELEKVDVKVKVDMDLTEWHIYRIAVYGDSSAVYIDEDPVPVVAGISTEGTSDTYIKIGDGSSDPMAGYVDWVIMDTTMAGNPDDSELPTVLTGIAPVDKGEWMFYTADVLPNENIPDFEESSVSGTGQINRIIDDPVLENNKLLEMVIHPEASSYLWKYNFEDPQSAVTIVTRIKGIDSLDRPMEIDLRHGGFRERLFIKTDNTFELKYSGITGDLPNVLNWHAYRITKIGNHINLYLDEANEPIATGVTPEVDESNNYFRFGDGNSSTTVGGLVDYVIWNESGPFTPEEFAVPDSLPVGDAFSFDASLASLESTAGIFKPAFDPEVLDYDLRVPEGTSTLTLTAEPNHPAATAVGDGEITIIPGSVTITVTAEDGTKRVYNIEVGIMSTDATLSELTPSVGALDPAFNSDSLEYSISVPFGTASVYITAVASDELSTISGDGTFTNIPGVDTVKVTAENGAVIEYIIDVQVATSVETETLAGLNIYPNPVNDELNIECEKIIKSIEIFNVLGEEILNFQPLERNSKINISQLSTGIYFIHLSDGHASSTLRIVKK